MEVVVAFIGLSGVVVGALLTLYIERRRWERDTKLDAYIGLILSVDKLRRLVTAEDRDEQRDENAVREAAYEAADAWALVSLVGGGNPNKVARKWFLPLTGAIVVTTEKYGPLMAKAARKIALEGMDDRWEFIVAVRKELRIKPHDIGRRAREISSAQEEEDGS